MFSSYASAPADCPETAGIFIKGSRPMFLNRAANPSPRYFAVKYPAAEAESMRA